MNTARKPSVIFFLMIFAWVSLAPRIGAQLTTETLLSSENEYKPIPNPDGKHPAYVRTDWRGSGGSGALFAQAQPGAHPTPPSDQQAMIAASSICDVGTTDDQLTIDEAQAAVARDH